MLITLGKTRRISEFGQEDHVDHLAEKRGELVSLDRRIMLIILAPVHARPSTPSMTTKDSPYHVEPLCHSGLPKAVALSLGSPMRDRGNRNQRTRERPGRCATEPLLTRRATKDENPRGRGLTCTGVHSRWKSAIFTANLEERIIIYGRESVLSRVRDQTLANAAGYQKR